MHTRFRKSIESTIRIAWLVFGGLIFVSCGSSSKSEDPVPVLRRGQDLVVHSFESSDTSPSMSDAGDKIVFISTRDKVARIYKVGEQGAVSSLLVEGVTDSNKRRLPETRAWLSPDGAYLLFTVNSFDVGQSQQALYRVNYDGSKLDQIKTITKVSVVPLMGVVDLVTFSSDSKLFALTTTVSGKRSVFVGSAVNAVVSPLLNQAEQKSQSSKEDRSAAFFLATSTAGPYTLVSFTREDTGTTFSKWDFTDEKLADVSEAKWASSSKNLMLNQQIFARGKSLAYFMDSVIDGSTMIGANGDASVLKDKSQLASDLRTPLKNWFTFLNLSGGDFGDVKYWQQLGSDIQSVSLSQENELGVYVTREMHKCKGSDDKDLDTVWGQGLFLVQTVKPADTVKPIAQKPVWLLPHSDAGYKDWKIGGDPCSVAQGRQGDFTIQSAQINAGASADKYRIVYSSQIGARNSRLFILDHTAKLSTITSIAVN